MSELCFTGDVENAFCVDVVHQGSKGKGRERLTFFGAGREVLCSPGTLLLHPGRVSTEGCLKLKLWLGNSCGAVGTQRSDPCSQTALPRVQRWQRLTSTFVGSRSLLAAMPSGYGQEVQRLILPQPKRLMAW